MGRGDVPGEFPDGAIWRIAEGDCVEQMRAMAEASADAIVCDPPYLLTFMGRSWDHAPTPAEGQAIHLHWAREALRVLKPGGHLLAFGGTRTYHRLACAIEDAGFEIRDTIAWLYGSGFPKSLDVGKAIDAAAGAEREIVGTNPHYCAGRIADPGSFAQGGKNASEHITAPATPDAERWQGWGTALKPAHEPIVVARKPLVGTVAANVLAHGTGALNVDATRCRIEGVSERLGNVTPHVNGNGITHGAMTVDRTETPFDPTRGRWPANVVLDPEAARRLDASVGDTRSAGAYVKGNGVQGAKEGAASIPIDGLMSATYDDVGGPSRYFYVAKASSAERNAGLDGFEAAETRTYGDCGPDGTPMSPNGQTAIVRQNVHPTVKPIDLMRWLVRLVTPPGGLILDPFAGSGTTGAAAVLEGFRFAGIERDPEYAAIARARIAWWAKHPDGMELVQRLEHEAERKRVAESGQMDLFAVAEVAV